MATSEKVKLVNVRLSYPNIFKKGFYGGVQNKKFDATFIIPKSQKKTIAKINSLIGEVLKEDKMKRPSEEKLCIKDGDETDKEEYFDSYTLKALNENRFTTLNRDKTPATIEENPFYGGCYVNAIVSFWTQKSHGGRVNANLEGIQFYKDGEPFGNGPSDTTDHFDDVSYEEDDDYESDEL
mgnify:CR=1 FL=1